MLRMKTRGIVGVVVVVMVRVHDGGGIGVDISANALFSYSDHQPRNKEPVSSVPLPERLHCLIHLPPLL